MKYIFALLAFSFLVACGGDSGELAGMDPENRSEFIAGQTVYENNCIACHQQKGEGVEGAFPPLAGSDYLLADKNRAIKVAANGLSGEIKVNGKTYNSSMASQSLSNQEVMDVMNYILNSWGNDGGKVTLAEVEAALK